MTRAWAALALLLAACSSCGGAQGASSEVREPTRDPEHPRPSADWRDPSRSPLGTNLDSVNDWSAELPFVDLFRAARPWNSSIGMGEDDDQRPIDVDAHGWPRQLADNQIVRTGMLNMGDIHARAGRYVVLWEGDGEVEYFGGVEHHLVDDDSRPGRHVLDFDPQGDEDVDFFGLAITRTNPSDPVRNVRVLLPGGACEDDERRWCDEESPCASGAACVPFEDSYAERPFNPDFLAQLDLYGVIRFMNWMSINDSEVTTWDERPKLDDASWARGNGVPLEIIAALSNALHADPWICIPHGADDDYVRRTGQLLEQQLDPARRVWLEYSNEVWNGMFQQAHHARDEGVRLGLAPADERANAYLRYYARRSMEVFDAFGETFPRRERVVRVIAGQAPNLGLSHAILGVDGVAEASDALAIAPYFGTFVNPENRDEVLGTGIEELLTEAREEQIPQVMGWVREQHELAEEHGLSLVAYEAGQHYVGVNGVEHDDEVNAHLDRLNRHPGFEAVYRQYLEGWHESGGGMLAHFVHCSTSHAWGRFGATEWMGQPPEDAPKLRAIIRFVDSTPRWW